MIHFGLALMPGDAGGDGGRDRVNGSDREEQAESADKDIGRSQERRRAVLC